MELTQWSEKQVAWLAGKVSKRKSPDDSDVEENEREQAELDDDQSDDGAWSIESPVRRPRKKGNRSARRSSASSTHKSTRPANISAPISVLTHNTYISADGSSLTHSSSAAAQSLPQSSSSNTAARLHPHSSSSSAAARLNPHSSSSSAAARLHPHSSSSSATPDDNSGDEGDNGGWMNDDNIASFELPEEPAAVSKGRRLDTTDSGSDSGSDSLEAVSSALVALARPAPRLTPPARSRATPTIGHASLAADANSALFSNLDLWRGASDRSMCDPSAKVACQPLPSYYHDLDTTALSDWLTSQGLQLTYALNTPTVSLHDPNDYDGSRCYYISYRNTKTGMNQLFMKIDIKRSTGFGTLERWAFDPIDSEYAVVHTALPDRDILQCLRLQQLLHMMAFFMSYKTVSATRDIRDLGFIKVIPVVNSEASDFFDVVVNNNIGYKDPGAIITIIAGDPILRLNLATYERLLARYMTLYGAFHARGSFPKALTESPRSKPKHSTTTSSSSSHSATASSSGKRASSTLQQTSNG